MVPESVYLRPARPTIDEGRRFARFLDVAADGVFRFLLGRSYDRIIGDAYLIPAHDLSYENVVFAERGGSIAGTASAYSAAQHRQSTEAPLRKAAGIHVVRMIVLGALANGLLGFIDDVPDGDFYLQAVAVDEVHRGAGIGSRLIDHAEDRALAAGCSRFVLDVAESNDGARRLYERRGMTVEAKSPPLFLTPGTGVLRMAKPV